MDEEEYLGDGLYVSFDGYQFRLRAPDSGGDRVIYLEPGVVTTFNDYVTKIYQRMKKLRGTD